MAGETVQNALSPEEKPIIENIISLFQQLLSMQENQMPTEEVVTEAMGEEADMEEVDVNKSAEGETGDDPAEKRVEEVTPTTDLSLQELKKSINTLVGVLNGKAKVAKAKTANVQKSQSTQVLTEISKVLKSIVEKQSAQEELNKQMFDAMGVTDEIIAKTLPQNDPVQKDKPIQNVDTAQVVKDILTEVFKNIPGMTQNQEYRHPFNQKRDVRKNLKGIAEYIHAGTSGK